MGKPYSHHVLFYYIMRVHEPINFEQEYESLKSEINAQLEFDPEMTGKICPKCNSETTTRAYDDGMTSDGRQYWDYKTSCTKCEWSEWD